MNSKIWLSVALFCLCSDAHAAPVRFEGEPRACAGAVPDATHQFKVVAKGLEPGQILEWRFENTTARGGNGAIKTPKIWNAGWRAQTTLRADERGDIILRVLSGQAVEEPFLVGRAKGIVVARLQCDFDGANTLRRSPDALADDVGSYYGNLEDTGYIFDDGLALGQPFSRGKVFWKFRRSRKRGDVDGNWSVVNGHKIRFFIASVSFNKDVFRSDGAKVSELTDPKDTKPYAFVRPENTFAVTKRDGSASFRYDFGPKARPANGDDWPQITVGVEDVTTFEPNKNADKWKPLVRSVPSAGAAITWEKNADELRGQLLLSHSGKPKRTWNIVQFGPKGKAEKPLALADFSERSFGLSAPLWSPRGDRFRLLASGVTNDYSVQHGIFNTAGALLGSFGPLYPTWGHFSRGGQFAFATGSTQVVGSGRIDGDYALHVWDGTRQNNLPVGPSFLGSDEATAMVDWTSESQLLVTQAVVGANRARPQLRIDAVNASGKGKGLWMKNAWMPLVSPDGKRVAFWGPESARQKPTSYWSSQPLDQSLCVARLDKAPFPSRPNGFNSRLPLDRFAFYPTILWSPDSRFLFAARTEANDGHPRVIVSRYNAQDGQFQRVGAFDYAVPEREKSDSFNSYTWRFDQISRDGKWLFLSLDQLEDDPNSSVMFDTKQWFRFRLSDGTLQLLATFRGEEFAWHDET